MSNKPTAKKAFSQKTVVTKKHSREEDSSSTSTSSSSSSSALPPPRASRNKYLVLSQRKDYVALQGVFETIESANICMARLQTESTGVTNTVYLVKHFVFPDPATAITKE